MGHAEQSFSVTQGPTHGNLVDLTQRWLAHYLPAAAEVEGVAVPSAARPAVHREFLDSTHYAALRRESRCAKAVPGHDLP